MKNKFIVLISKFDEQAIRIRLLITAAILMVFGLAIDSLWLSPNFQLSEKLEVEIAQTENTIQELINTQQTLNQNFANQRNHPLKKQIEQLDLQINNVKQNLKDKTINLIQPEAMSSVLSEIISRSKNLKLISLTKKPPVALFQDQTQGSNNQQKPKVEMYQHMVELVLQGKYQETQKFIQQLETMPQKVNFESLDFHVENYPQSTITLVVSTLSLNKKWIGG